MINSVWVGGSFKIWDRVWIAGITPGRIAYIGSTKFADGDWAVSSSLYPKNQRTPTSSKNSTSQNLRKSLLGPETGVLRFMGTTEFAPGIWCGIELDNPVGKNDGSVSGKRYRFIFSSVWFPSRFPCTGLKPLMHNKLPPFYKSTLFSLKMYWIRNNTMFWMYSDVVCLLQ